MIVIKCLELQQESYRIQMSFKAVFQVFLQIHQYTNIDLPCQGQFRLRASVYQKQEKQIIYAQPFQFMNPKPPLQSKKIPIQPQIQPPYFYSKAGIIKYSDQSLQLNDQVRFKLEVQSFPRLHSQQIFIDFQLIYQQIAYSSSKIAEQGGEAVEKKTFKFDMLEHGICSYCEGQFIGNYSSKFSFTVYACLSNFQFGKYKLLSEIEAVWKEGEQGKIVTNTDPKKSNQNVRVKELERSKVKSFEEFLVWVGKYYKERVNNPLQYFYNTYVKNLRYYFYLAQQKLDQNSLIKQKKILKVPKQFLQLPESSNSLQTEVSEKQFRNYMQKYQPKDLTALKILSQINIIYGDIYMFLVEVQNQFRLGQLMRNKMSKKYQAYIKDRYGQRVFKSVIRSNQKSGGVRENKKIAKKMRQKQVITTVTYPIEDISFIQSKQMMQFLFYQITYPQQSPTKQNIHAPKIQMKKEQIRLNVNESLTASERPPSKIFDEQSNVEEQVQQQGQNLIQSKKEQKLLKNEEIILQDKQQSVDLSTNKQKEEQQKEKAKQKQKENSKEKEQEKQNRKDIEKQKQQQHKIQQKVDEQLNQINENDEQKHQTQIHLQQNIKILEQENQQKQDVQKAPKQTQPSFKSIQQQIQYLREQQRIEKQLKMLQLKEKQKQQAKLKLKNQQQDNSYEQKNIFQGASQHEGESMNSQLTQKSFQNLSYSNSEPDEKMNQLFQGISDIELSSSDPLPQLNYNQDNMLIILCHGFQGSSFDMSLILRGLKQVLPNACYLLSRSNQGQTQGNIQEMGQKLAEEVQKYIRNYMNKNSVILNFVGHSMGGIVARAGAKYLMKDYYNQFGFFCSLSSPHLGYLNGVDGMIKAGLWAILKFKPIKSLQQLKMDDQKEMRKSFLYKLSKQGNLKRFRKIILFSSFEDSYVSWNSARISAHTSKTSKSAKVEQQMTANILGSAPIHRIDVNFNVQTKNLDSFIGRTAHINLIIQQSLFKIINSTIPQLFDLRKP